MKVILIGTGDIALQVIEKLYDDTRIELLGVILDDAVNESINKYYAEKIEEIGVEILEYNEDNICKADIIYACEYRRAIPKEYVDKYVFANCHAGILPKYRGFSANAWAIINGEHEIGYTIHRMNDKFDDGDIYYVGKFNIDEDETYADLYDQIFDDMINRICDILYDVYTGAITPIKQNTYGVYCSKFYANLGNLKDFDETSSYLYNLHRCMAKPHGTGVFFVHKEKKYYVRKIRTGKKLGLEDYIGIPGKIVNIQDGELWVKTKDNVLLLSQLETENNENVDLEMFKIGNKLGK